MQTITSRDNHIIKDTTKLIKSSSYRTQWEKYVIEGVRICSDAVDSHVSFATVLLAQNAVEKYPKLITLLQEICESTFIISDKLFSQISDTKTPQGVMCVCNKSTNRFMAAQGKRYLALECIQDPANMGTILRTAEALGINGVYITADCCDIYSPKVLRGSMGAVFRLPVNIVPDFTSITAYLNNNGVKTFATVPDSTAYQITQLSSTEKESCSIFIGNEGNGLSQQTIDNCTKCVTIPMKGRAESLNASVAAAIAMWEILR
ncbi:MAG TPA: RNA methyltransferase [Clostridiales bacterium]|nr:RNA methyltransferase [Clostridiales bacterium]